MKELQRGFIGTARSEDAGVVGGQPHLCRKKDFHGFRFGASTPVQRVRMRAKYYKALRIPYFHPIFFKTSIFDLL